MFHQITKKIIALVTTVCLLVGVMVVPSAAADDTQMYLYNGIELPSLPLRDENVYPYAYVCYLNSLINSKDGYYVWFTHRPLYSYNSGEDYMNSQSYDIDKKIRDVVDSMILQTSVLDCISISRPIRRTVTLTEPSADSESRIADRLSFAPLWDWKFMWMPNYHKYFDSFSAPPRDPIPYRQIPGSLYKHRPSSRQILNKLQRSLNRKDDAQ